MSTRLVSATLIASASLVLSAAPATALVRPYMNVDVFYEFGRHKVCFEGRVIDDAAQIGGSWSAAIFGRRADGTEINIATSGFGTTFTPPCVYVNKNNVPQGGYTVRFLFDGFGVDCDPALICGPDFDGGQPHPFVVGGIGTWRPDDNQFILG